jgi:ribokinase
MLNWSLGIQQREKESLQMNSNPKIAVVGSVNVDLVVETERYPQLGETILGSRFSELPGGKGANQAVAASRLGADVTFIGCIGDDSYGEFLTKNFSNESVNTQSLLKVEGEHSGIAHITVAQNDNLIIVIPGANYALTPEKIRQHEETIKHSDIVLVQLEVPIETVAETVSIANKYNIPVVLNPAPATKLPLHILQGVDYLTPNETELTLLTDIEIDSEESIKSAFDILFKGGVKNIVLTRGAKGAVFAENHNKQLIFKESYSITPVDTTGAGDAFNASLAFSLANGCLLDTAVEFSNKVAALSTTKFGAQSGLPTAEEVNYSKMIKGEV